MLMTVSRENPGVVNRKAGYPEEFRQRVRQAVKEEPDKTRAQIAAEFGISVSVIQTWVPSNINQRYFDQYHHNVKKVREMHWEGCTYSYIARVTGIARSTVWDYVNRPWLHAER